MVVICEYRFFLFTYVGKDQGRVSQENPEFSEIESLVRQFVLKSSISTVQGWNYSVLPYPPGIY